MKRLHCWLLGHDWQYNDGDPVCARCGEHSGEWRWALGRDKDDEVADPSPDARKAASNGPQLSFPKRRVPR